MKTIFGHDRQIKNLSLLAKDFKSRKEGRGDSVIFFGPSKIGKFSLAKEFTKLFFCESLEDTLDLANFCGKCKACMNILKNKHPDVLVIDNLWSEKEDSDMQKVYSKTNIDQTYRQKKKVKTADISVDDIRAIEKRLTGKTLGEFRFCLIKKAERMNQEASNALLKILEEPPKNTFFILTATNPDRLLPTITSRCKSINFRNLSEKQSIQALSSIFPDISEKELEKALFLSQGRVGRGVDLLTNSELYEEFAEIYRQLETIFKDSSIKFRFDIAKKLGERKTSGKGGRGISLRFLRLMIYYLRHRLKALVNTPKSTNNRDFMQISSLIEETSSARKYIRANVNPKLVLENLFLRF